MKRPLFSYYGFYPIHTWWMEIHCGNCHHEGRCKLNTVHYWASLLGLIFIGVLTYCFYQFAMNLPPGMYYARRGGRVYIALVALFVFGLYYFCKPQKYFCAKCGSKDGTPLKFHRYLNR